MIRTLLLAIAIVGSLRAQTPSEKSGKTVFDKWCLPCHGAVASAHTMFGSGALPGTAALAVKYQGKVPAVLEQRTDLKGAFIKSVVRHGLYGMPITRKTEVSDAELDDVVVYLTEHQKK